jgi:hypothetical protein
MRGEIYRSAELLVRQLNMSLSHKMHITIALAMALTMGVGVWYLRGAYDDVMMNAGDFHVVNASDQELDIVLRFPSGAIRSCKLAIGQGQTIHVPDTGEGSIVVTVNQKKLEPFGYVTSHNLLSVLTVRTDTAFHTYP